MKPFTGDRCLSRCKYFDGNYTSCYHSKTEINVYFIIFNI